MAKGNRAGSKVLSDDQEVSKKRDIWVGQREFLQYLSIAYGSLAELETHLEISQCLNYIDQNESKDIVSQDN